MNECLKVVPRLSFPQLHFLADGSVGDKQEKKQSVSSRDPQKTGQKRKTKISKKEKESVKGDKGPNAGDGHTQDSQRSQQGQPPAVSASTTEGVPVAGTITDMPRESGQGTYTLLEEHRWKFRALTLTCTAILSIPEVCLGIFAQLQSFLFRTCNLCHCALFTKICWSLNLILLITYQVAWLITCRLQ